MGFEKVGVLKLSKSGRAVEIKLDLPSTQFTTYLYCPRVKVEQILNNKLGETPISLLTKK